MDPSEVSAHVGKLAKAPGVLSSSGVTAMDQLCESGKDVLRSAFFEAVRAAEGGLY